MSRGLNYHHLRYFHAVAHDGNLTRTAERLNLSQSALSTQIRKLEEQLGHSLFDRRGRQLELTEAGRIVLDHADAIFATGDELVGTLTERQTDKRQHLRVGALATLSRNFQFTFLKQVLTRDDVHIAIHSGRFADLMQGLDTHALDVALVNYLPTRDAATPWIAHRIADQPVSVVGHRKRLKKTDTALTLIKREPIVLPSIETGIRVSFDAYIERLGIKPQIAAEVDDMAMLRVLARENIGITVVPPIVVKDELQSGLLVEADQVPDLTEAFYAVTLKRRFPNPLLKTLLQQ
ncbi:MAG: LysR family transcriptional regulator [Pseudomonadota bacterium]